MSAGSLTFVVKTSFGCNLACAYCYEGHKPGTERLSASTAANLVAKAAAYASIAKTHITFVWHGGEPLLLGQAFYQHVLDLQRRSFADPAQFRNMLQTNGLLLDDGFAAFLGKNGFHVGVSLDGPATIHDAQRRTKNGKPSYPWAVDALAKLRQYGVDPGALAIFTRNTLDHLDEFYDFCRGLGVAVRINPLLTLGSATDANAHSLRVDPREFGEALVGLFDRWIKEPTFSFQFEPFFGIIRSLIGGRVYSCTLAGRCHDFSKLYPNGDIYMCGTQERGVEPVGNINSDDLVAILSSPERINYAQEKANVKTLCVDCPHFNICHGGCTTAAFAAGGNLPRDSYCEGYRILFDHVKSTIPKEMIMGPSTTGTMQYNL